MQGKRTWFSDQAFGKEAAGLITVSYKSHTETLHFLEAALNTPGEDVTIFLEAWGCCGVRKDPARLRRYGGSRKACRAIRPSPSLKAPASKPRK